MPVRNSLEVVTNVPPLSAGRSPFQRDGHGPRLAVRVRLPQVLRSKIVERERRDGLRRVLGQQVGATGQDRQARSWDGIVQPFSHLHRKVWILFAPQDERRTDESGEVILPAD